MTRTTRSLLLMILACVAIAVPLLLTAKPLHETRYVSPPTTPHYVWRGDGTALITVGDTTCTWRPGTPVACPPPK